MDHKKEQKKVCEDTFDSLESEVDGKGPKNRIAGCESEEEVERCPPLELMLESPIRSNDEGQSPFMSGTEEEKETLVGSPAAKRPPSVKEPARNDRKDDDLKV